MRVLQHVIVPEADDQIAFRFDHSGSGCIGFPIVLSAIDLDDDTQTMAGEVRDEMADGYLTAEAAFRKVGLEKPPHRFCRFGRIDA